MFLHGLQTKIAVILVMILVTAMFLIDFVMITSAQHILFRSEISKAHLFIFALENSLIAPPSESKGVILNSVLEDSFDRMFEESGIHCALVLDKNVKEIYFVGNCSEFQDKLYALSQKVIASGKKESVFSGSTWGIFWKQKQNLIITAPLYKGNQIVAGASVVLQLEDIYKILRQTHYILLIYILINTVVLTFVGLYRLSKVTVKPIHKLLQKTEDYSGIEDDMILISRNDNEFNQLSKALNRMLKRISDDKEKLQDTVQSLEKANKELKQAQKDVIRAEKLASVGRLAAGIAHEIGNPIAIVIGYLELLKREDISDDEKKEFIIRAENEINRINIIIRQLLDFSRPTEVDMKPVSIHEIITDITSVIQYQPLMADIELTLDLSAQQDTVMADPHQLRQIFLNLIINAADAIASDTDRTEHGKLVIHSEIISASEADDETFSGRTPILKIVYMDNGPGIPEENMEYIFDPFYTTKEPGKGTGLGLWVSIMIIEASGGKIRAISEVGKGTTMSIFLPLL